MLLHGGSDLRQLAAGDERGLSTGIGGRDEHGKERRAEPSGSCVPAAEDGRCGGAPTKGLRGGASRKDSGAGGVGLWGHQSVPVFSYN